MNSQIRKPSSGKEHFGVEDKTGEVGVSPQRDPRRGGARDSGAAALPLGAKRTTEPA